MRRRVPDISKIKQVIGWEPEVDLDEILTFVIGYFRRLEGGQVDSTSG